MGDDVPTGIEVPTRTVVGSDTLIRCAVGIGGVGVWMTYQMVLVEGDGEREICCHSRRRHCQWLIGCNLDMGDVMCQLASKHYHHHPLSSFSSFALGSPLEGMKWDPG